MPFSSSRLSPEAASSVVDILQDRLAALLDLSMTLKHIHWNVVGMNFIGVHEMLDPQYAAAAAMVDATAERISSMGGEPEGRMGHVAQSRSWDDYALKRAGVAAHLGALELVYDGVVRDHGKAIADLESLDPVTQDLLIGQTEQLEQFQWFVRAHLQDADGNLANAGARTEEEAAELASEKTRTGLRAPRRAARSGKKAPAVSGP